MGLLNLNLVENNIEALKSSFLNNDQPHVIIDDVLNDSPDKRKLLDEIQDPTMIDRMKLYSFLSTRSYETLGSDNVPPNAASLIEELTSDRFIKLMEQITGFKGIVPDKSVATGGLVFIPKNSFGGLHLDDRGHPFNPNLARRFTLLIYLNEGWTEEKGGYLELWDMKKKLLTKKVLPTLGKLILFDCDELVHSVATVKGEDGNIRKAITIWYYYECKNAPFRPSLYFSRPGSGIKNRALIFGVNCAYVTYLYLKKKLKFEDDLVVNFLKRLDSVFSNKKKNDRASKN